MKINLLIAAALVATSSTAFASINPGVDESSSTGGELIIGMWNDAIGKSILFDTGINFKSIVDNKNTPVLASIDLTTIDATYKSFFNNDMSHVSWNAYVGFQYSANYNYDDTTYFGIMYTAKNPEFEAANPYGYNELVGAMYNSGEPVSRFNQNFAVPQDLSGFEVNRSYRVSDVTHPGYLGDLGTKWGEYEANLIARGTSALGDSSIAFMFNTIDTTYTDGTNSQIGTASYDSATNTFKIAGLNTPPPAVPVPAAAWLLMSGIAGFGAIARRRKQQA